MIIKGKCQICNGTLDFNEYEYDTLITCPHCNNFTLPLLLPNKTIYNNRAKPIVFLLEIAFLSVIGLIFFGEYMGSFGGFIGLGLIFLLYFLPTIITFSNNDGNTIGVFIINLFYGIIPFYGIFNFNNKLEILEKCRQNWWNSSDDIKYLYSINNSISACNVAIGFWTIVIIAGWWWLLEKSNVRKRL
jgi:hypothetical protein